LIMSSVDVSFEEYIKGDIPKQKIIDMMAGEVYRLKEYPSKGYFQQQDIPEEVWNAYLELVSLGFDKRVK